jgi:large subunit ribosomal protein L21
MYAVIVTGGKQYRVTAGNVVEVEKLDVAVGTTVKIEHVLAVSGERSLIGTPTVAGAVVEAQVIAQGKGDKVLIFKKKRRHNYRRKNGHRQCITTLYITSVSLNGKALATAEPKSIAEKAAAPVVKTKKAAAPKAEAVAKPAAKKPAASTATKKPAAKKAAK